MPTTAGSWALAGSTPDDAFIAQKLKAAGAIIIGKANLSEWANFRSGPSSSGWSGIGGQTNMPYVLDRNPCGSSSGSGVVAAADLAVAAVGTETDGSIVCPSAPTASSGSSRRSGCGAAQASSRSAPTRTRPGRSPAT
jgi:amidase